MRALLICAPKPHVSFPFMPKVALFSSREFFLGIVSFLVTFRASPFFDQQTMFFFLVTSIRPDGPVLILPAPLILHLRSGIWSSLGREPTAGFVPPLSLTGSTD